MDIIMDILYGYSYNISPLWSLCKEIYVIKLQWQTSSITAVICIVLFNCTVSARSIVHKTTTDLQQTKACA